MEYKIFKEYNAWGIVWVVYSGHVSYGDWVKDESVYYNANIAECYAWIKAKQENLIGN